MRPIKDLLFWLLWGPGRVALSVLPLPMALAVGRAMGRLLSHVPSGARRAMERAARQTLGPDAPAFAIRKAARRGVENLVQNETEAMLFPRITPQNLSLFIESRGLSHLDAALAQGRGAVLLLAHFGANQMVMAAVGHSGRTICQISAPATALDDKMPGRRSRFFRDALRRRWENEQSLPVSHINVFGPLTKAVACLRAGHILAVAVDGGQGRRLASAPFLSRRARFNAGALELAARLGSPVLPVFVIRERNGRNLMVVEPPLPGGEVPGRAPREAARAMLNAYAPILERYVRGHPCHYLRYLAFRELMAVGGDEPFFEPAPASDGLPE